MCLYYYDEYLCTEEPTYLFIITFTGNNKYISVNIKLNNKCKSHFVLLRTSI